MSEEILYKPGEPWKRFPPNESDDMRIKEYEGNRKLFKGEHIEVFEKAKSWLAERFNGEKRLYIAVNYCQVVSNIIADMLFGEPLRICCPDNPALQVQLREMGSNTGLQSTLYESALSGSCQGGAVLKTSWTAKHGSSVSNIPMRNYFPHLDPDNQRNLLGATIAWLRRDGDNEYLRREIHTPGHVRQELWKMEGDVPKTQMPLSTLGIDMQEDIETGCDGLLVEYVPNSRLSDDFWGDSDYMSIRGPLEAINERLSQLHRVLDIHSEPVFVGPPGLLKKDSERQNYGYKRSRDTAIETGDLDTANIIRYVTWDAHLSAVFDDIDRLLDALMVCAEISPDMFGMGKSGYAESGRALKMRWVRQLAKRQRREMAYDPVVRRLLKNAAILDAKFGDGTAVRETDKITLLWGDGLPNDPKETAEEEALLLSAGISSRRSSYMRAMQAEEEDANREMAQIAKEQKEQADSWRGEMINETTEIE